MPSIANRNHSSASSAAPQTTVYYLVWRISPSQPWRSEEFFNRIDAHNRYFALLQRGVEAYLERRQSAVLSA
ncbi:MAG TPA: hypothetical protein VFV87_16250 [Pirellulaceae bacterium]|nr:hypothetical protein [Pirellulaceae bacterium]